MNGVLHLRCYQLLYIPRSVFTGASTLVPAIERNRKHRKEMWCISPMDYRLVGKSIIYLMDSPKLAGYVTGPRQILPLQFFSSKTISQLLDMPEDIERAGQTPSSGWGG